MSDNNQLGDAIDGEQQLEPSADVRDCVFDCHEIDTKLGFAGITECVVLVECNECGVSGTIYYHDDLRESC